jgi:cyclopropane-fatty-acyl-phospholipid synthase
MLALFDARTLLSDRFRLKPWLQFATDLFLRSPLRVNKNSIDHHYTFGNDFYLEFIDSRYRFYSHCIFESDSETLETAADHKLESMFRALDLPVV